MKLFMVFWVLKKRIVE